jgi:hypothetical protein
VVFIVGKRKGGAIKIHEKVILSRCFSDSSEIRFPEK